MVIGRGRELNEDPRKELEHRKDFLSSDELSGKASEATALHMGVELMQAPRLEEGLKGHAVGRMAVGERADKLLHFVFSFLVGDYILSNFLFFWKPRIPELSKFRYPKQGRLLSAEPSVDIIVAEIGQNVAASRMFDEFSKPKALENRAIAGRIDTECGQDGFAGCRNAGIFEIVEDGAVTGFCRRKFEGAAGVVDAAVEVVVARDTGDFFEFHFVFSFLVGLIRFK